MSNKSIHYLTITSIFAALITLTTAYVLHIPVPIAGGYTHLGDSLIFLAATILPTPYAMAAAAIGGCLADLLTAPMWALPTFIIKALITIPFSAKSVKILTLRNRIAPVFAYFISGTGYFLANTVLFNSGVALLTSFGASLVQSVASAIVFYLFATVLDKTNFKSKLHL